MSNRAETVRYQPNFQGLLHIGCADTGEVSGASYIGLLSRGNMESPAEAVGIANDSIPPSPDTQSHSFDQ